MKGVADEGFSVDLDLARQEASCDAEHLMDTEQSPDDPTAARRVLVRRALPTPAADRGSTSLFLAEADRQGIVASRKMLYVGLESASDHIASVLRVEPGADVIARRKLLLANDVPVRIATSFFRADLFGQTRIAEPGFVQPSLQSAVLALGFEFGCAEEELIARPQSPDEAETLQLEAGEWVVQILRTSFSTGDVPVHALETICAAARHVFAVQQVLGHDEF